MTNFGKLILAVVAVIIGAFMLAQTAKADGIQDGLEDPVVGHPLCNGSSAEEYPGFASMGVLYQKDDGSYFYAFADGDVVHHIYFDSDCQLEHWIEVPLDDNNPVYSHNGGDDNDDGDGGSCGSDGGNGGSGGSGNGSSGNGSNCNNGNGNGNEGCSPGQGHGANDDES